MQRKNTQVGILRQNLLSPLGDISQWETSALVTSRVIRAMPVSLASFPCLLIKYIFLFKNIYLDNPGNASIPGPFLCSNLPAAAFVDPRRRRRRLLREIWRASSILEMLSLSWLLVDCCSLSRELS